MKVWEKRIAEADWIYEVCKGCCGFLFGAADIPGCKRDIQAAIYRATKSGNQILLLKATADRESRPIGCKCPVEERREEMIDDAYQAARE